MDIEGLGKLIEANHSDNLRQFDTLRGEMTLCRSACNERFTETSQRCDELCKTVKGHTRTITQIKTIGSLASVVWGAIVLFASHIVSELVGK